MSLFRVTLLAGVLIAVPTVASAQFPPPPPPPGPAPVQNRWPETPPRRTQAAPQQQTAQPKNNPEPSSLDLKPDAKPEAKPETKSAAKAPPPASTAVTCGGVFAKDTTHLKLAIKYDSRNVTFDDVDGPDGTKIKATVLFPRDPRRRLEVLWNDDAARADVQVISINGKSQWSAPRGLKLGLPLATLEKLNGKPFKMSGFGPDGSGSVESWEDGKLAKLPGGCKVGIRLAPDHKASGDARSAVAGDKALLSNDASLKALKPTISEILIGY